MQEHTRKISTTSPGWTFLGPSRLLSFARGDFWFPYCQGISITEGLRPLFCLQQLSIPGWARKPVPMGFIYYVFMYLGIYFLFMAAPVAYGSSQARARIGVRGPTAQLVTTLDA